jgi:hypothetical protein
VLDTKSPKYLEMAQGHISLSRCQLPPGHSRGNLAPLCQLGGSVLNFG